MERKNLNASNDYIEEELSNRLNVLSTILKGDVLTMIVPIMFQTDQLIRKEIEAIGEHKKTLYVIIETGGGLIEVAEKIGNLFHHFYDEVNFIIPNRAMSAGTVLVMCGDSIYMDYFSVLGPIDPQVESSQGRWISALGYLDQYHQLVEKSRQGNLTAAEAAFMMQKFDPAELDYFKKARDLSIDLLVKWLVQYKFKNWKKTEGTGCVVTPEKRKERAEEIAKKLNNNEIWKTHSRGISMETLKTELNLMIENFGLNKELNNAIKSYNELLSDYLDRQGKQRVIHTGKNFEMF